jgi:hypothetical protein
MTPHLSPDQLVVAAEGRLAGDCSDHLERCDACRERVVEIRALLADVTLSAGVPEPSPLFWDHLSRRVCEATAVEPAPTVPWWHGLSRPLVALGVVAGAVALVVMLRGWRPGEEPQPATTGVVAETGLEPASQDDASVEVVSAVAGDLSFDELRTADLVPSRAVVDLAVSQLTQDQQRELMRLMREDLGGLE